MPPLIDESEIEFSAVRAQGAGGQNVNKVSTAVHLRFDIRASSLPAEIKDRLLELQDQRISKQGVIVIKAQATRSQEQNRADALARLNELVTAAATPRKTRRATKPTHGSRLRRLEGKSLRSKLKAARSRVQD